MFCAHFAFAACAVWAVNAPKISVHLCNLWLKNARVKTFESQTTKKPPIHANGGFFGGVATRKLLTQSEFFDQ